MSGAFRQAWRVWRSPSTPFWLKLLPVLTILYAFSPLDVVPDILPVLGWIDDAILLLIAFTLLLSYRPTEFKSAGDSPQPEGRKVVEGRARPYHEPPTEDQT